MFEPQVLIGRWAGMLLANQNTDKKSPDHHYVDSLENHIDHVFRNYCDQNDVIRLFSI